MSEATCFPPEYCRARVLVLGCGNVLFGDDGFGPAVADHLNENFDLPEGFWVANVGLSAREILFTIALSDVRPARIIIVDAVDAGKAPGELFEIHLCELPEKKIDDFSMHQMPTSNLLRELEDFCGVEITIIAAQVERIPDSVCPGLSSRLTAAIPAACELVLKKGVLPVCTSGK